jgi:type IV pilus assembly protein PilY1
MVYAGDLQGNLWRVDISNSTPSNWVVSVLFQARDAAGHLQPITTAPVATLNPRYPQIAGTMVFFGTGQLLGIPDLSDVNVQTIYGVYDPPGGYATPLTYSSLVQQTLSAATIGTTNVALVSGNPVSIPSTKGWYINLTLNSGERVVNTPLLRSGALVVTSTQPSTSSCTAGGVSFSYFINFATGSAFPTPQFAITGNVINSSDTYTNPVTGVTSVPLGVELGGGFYANATMENTAPSCTGTGCTTGSGGTGAPPGYVYVYNCPASGSLVCTPRLMKGSISHRISWWEVRQ